jgi:hypothetical protein
VIVSTRNSNSSFKSHPRLFLLTAVADVPIVNVPISPSAVDEDSAFQSYPVTFTLGDTDGSESLISVRVKATTPGSSSTPVVDFGTSTGITFTNSTGSVVLTGTQSNLIAAVATLMVKPGFRNGEDITVTITAVESELNTTEPNNNGPGLIGTEIAVPTATGTNSFVIPVSPIVGAPIVLFPSSATGLEDTTFALGVITVATDGSDTDGSETPFLEIVTSSFPLGTAFWSSGVQVNAHCFFHMISAFVSHSCLCYNLTGRGGRHAWIFAFHGG